MATNIIFLGTSCMVPTAERNHQGVFLEHQGSGILFDCGEGIQRQMKLAKIRPTQINKIVISHWHGDHVLGLPGLLQTMSSSDYTGKLQIYGPKGSIKYFEHMFKAFVFDSKLDMEITEFEKDGEFVSNNDYSIEAYKLEHKVLTYGFRFIEKDRLRVNLTYTKSLGIPEGPLLGKLQNGKNIVFNGKKIEYEKATRLVPGKIIGIISDTVICNNCYKIADNADLLISEATYTHDLKDKADLYQHLTAQETAQIASQSNASKLIVTHLSQRYKTDEEIRAEVTTFFEDSDVAYDLMKVKV